MPISHIEGGEGGSELPLGTLPAGHGASLEFCPEVVCDGFGEAFGTAPLVVVEFVFVAFELEELEPFMPGFVVGSLGFEAFAPEDAGTHGVALGTFGAAGAVGCVFPGVGDGAVVVGAGVSWPFVVWFVFWF